MTDDAFLKTLDQETAIQAAMLHGDPGPLISYWADCDDITVFGGWGRIEKEHQPVTDVMRWVASRFTGAGAVDLEHLGVASSGDLAYTADFERSHVSVDGGPRRDMTLRVTPSTGASTAPGNSSTGTPTSPSRSTEELLARRQHAHRG